MLNDDDAARLATTESLFREVNERIGETAVSAADTEVAFVCECGRRDCTHRVDATLEDYEGIRSSPHRFLVVPGHEDDRIEEVVAERPGFRVVEKVQQRARATVERLDPRATPA